MPERKDITSQITALKNRKAEVARNLEASIEALADDMATNAAAIDQKERELAELREKHRAYESAAKRYLEGSVDVLSMNIVQFQRGPKRTRTDLRGTVLDLSDLRQTVSHRFAETGEVVIGTLDEQRARGLDGKPWTDSSAELVDALWKLPDGEGFYTHTARRGVKLNPLAVFKDKGHGRLVAADGNSVN